MELHEHDQFVLTADVTGDEDEELKPGDVGVIIHIHSGGEAFVGEFVTLNGNSSAIARNRSAGRAAAGSRSAWPQNRRKQPLRRPR